MKSLKLVVCLGTLALASSAASANKFNVTLYEPSVVAGTELKPGDYRVEVNGDKVTIKGARETVETSVKVEETSVKNARTSVRYDTAGGKNKIEEIRLGGTKTKLVFGGSAGAGAPAN